MTSTKATLAIDHSSQVPLHEQVAAAIRRAIADGEAAPGDRLPLAKDLAAGVTYAVNQQTGRIATTVATPGTFPDGCSSGVATGAGAVWVSARPLPPYALPSGAEAIDR